MLASNDRNRDGVDLSIVADAPAAVAVCPLGSGGEMQRLLYVSLPPACATTDWLAVISLAAKEYQQAEALMREKEQARNRAALEQDLENARAIQHSILPEHSEDLGRLRQPRNIDSLSRSSRKMRWFYSSGWKPGAVPNRDECDATR